MHIRAVGLTFGAAFVLAAAGCAREAHAPRIETREVEYRAGEIVLKGLVAWDAAAQGKRPGVLVVHEWWGQTSYERDRARQLAAAGYVALAVDMFGDGKTTSHPEEAGAFAAEANKDAAVLAARFRAGLEQLQQDPHVDPERIAAIGYCFGGTVVLSQARAGTDLDAVVSFHGALPTGPVDAGMVKGRVLVLTGAADPWVPAEAVEAFRRDMAAVGDRVRIVSYPNARHAFTNPAADSHGMEQLAYDAAADSASWQAMKGMFGEVWK